jgi:hypothetical protein
LPQGLADFGESLGELRDEGGMIEDSLHQEISALVK